MMYCRTVLPPGARTSLWGCRGEAANASLAAGALYDWSYAGYAAGDAQLPSLTISADIKSEFGAVGDGVADDSSPFLDAIRYVRNRAVIYIPPGGVRGGKGRRRV
jgi:hypothetical protein